MNKKEEGAAAHEATRRRRHKNQQCTTVCFVCFARFTLHLSSIHPLAPTPRFLHTSHPARPRPPCPSAAPPSHSTPLPPRAPPPPATRRPPSASGPRRPATPTSNDRRGIRGRMQRRATRRGHRAGGGSCGWLFWLIDKEGGAVSVNIP